MKQALLFSLALLLSHISHAQFTRTITGALTATTPASSSFFRFSSALTACNTKTWNGSTATSNSSYPYQRYTITNNSTSSSCITFQFAPTCTEVSSPIGVVMFSGNVQYGTTGLSLPSNLNSLYRSDSGSYLTSGNTVTFSVLAAAGETLTLVVTTNTSQAYCSSYTLTISSPAPLPVDLVSFTGKATPTGNALAWATTSEKGNLGFTVERSADGQGFIALGQVAGAGTSTQSHAYTYLDPTPLPLSYYRLRQQDADGHEQFSPVVVVQAADMLSFYPNPVTNSAIFTSPAATTLTVRDALGRVAQVLLLAAGSQSIDLRALPAGLYTLTDEATHHTSRLVRVAE